MERDDGIPKRQEVPPRLSRNRCRPHRAETFGRDPRALPGAGAAGGLPAGLWAALGAELVPGFAALADRLGLDAALEDAALVVTGEGRFDGPDEVPTGRTRCRAHDAGAGHMMRVPGT